MIDSLVTSIIYIFTLLFPIFFLPYTSEFYEYNKMMLLIATAVLLFILYTLKIAVTKSVAFAINSFTLALFLITTLFLISTFLTGSNLTSTLITPLSTSTMIFGFILYLLLINLVTPKVKERLMTILTISASLLSIYSILLFVGFIPKSPYTPAGNLLTTAVFLSVIAFYLIAVFREKTMTGIVIPHLMRDPHSQLDGSLVKPGMTKGNSISSMFYVLSFLIIGTGLTVLSLTLTTDQKPIILPYKYGIEILTQVLKDPKTLLIGVGPTKFLAAYTLGKPTTINYTPYWNFIFTSSSSHLLTLSTEVGILAGVLYIFIFQIALINFHRSPFILPLIICLFLQVILPADMPVFILTVILLAISSHKKVLFSINLSKLNILKILVYLSIVPTLAISAVTLYFLGKFYIAEIYFKKSLDALSQNQGSTSYIFLKKAIDLAPHADRYRVTFSQTNLALANALAQEKEASDEKKQNIPKLVQQAIDQARIAVALNQTSVVNWDNLGKVYASLTNFAQGSSEWAIGAYKEKVMLDPNNPLARFDLGSFYVSQKRFAEAETLFKEAINLKTDYPNFHYNLAVSLREQKKYREAYAEFQTTLTLLPPGSDDVKKVDREMEELKKFLPF